MADSPEVQQAKADTAEALGVDESSLGYITDELLAEYQDAEDDGSPFLAEDGTDAESDADSGGTLGVRQTFGNHLYFTTNLVYYKNGRGPNPPWFCDDTNKRSWQRKKGDKFTVAGDCGDSFKYWKLYGN